MVLIGRYSSYDDFPLKNGIKNGRLVYTKDQIISRLSVHMAGGSPSGRNSKEISVMRLSLRNRCSHSSSLRRRKKKNPLSRRSKGDPLFRN
jgi:hypothetical protein